MLAGVARSMAKLTSGTPRLRLGDLNREFDRMGAEHEALVLLASGVVLVRALVVVLVGVPFLGIAERLVASGVDELDVAADGHGAGAAVGIAGKQPR